MALAAVAPLFTALPLFVRWFLAAAIAANGVRCLVAFRHPRTEALAWSEDDVWTVTLRGGADKLATLAGWRIVGTAVFLHLRWPGGAGHLALLADNTPADALRLLRARLSTQKRP